MKEFITYGHVDDQGKLSIYNKDAFSERLKSDFKKTTIEIIVRERFYQFTDGQRGYYFGVIVKEIQQAWKATGILKSISDIDQELRNKFLYYEVLNQDTDKYEKHLHTLKKHDTSVSAELMREYCECCIIWCIQNLDWAIAYSGEDFGEYDMTEKQFRFHNGIKEKSTF